MFKKDDWREPDKKTNNGQQSTSHKTKDWATRIPTKQEEG
jgi:hypothetical protein